MINPLLNMFIKNRNKLGRSTILILIYFIFILIISCKKDNNNPINETSTLTDIDGNVYKTVKIGTQWWMAENLKVKRYLNGDSIIYVSYINYDLDSAKWNNLTSGAYCIINSLDSSSQNYKGKLFGFLYNGYTVSDSRNIAPQGWHVPSDNDWKTLEENLGMNTDDANKMNWRGTVEGNKMKIYTGWIAPSDIYNTWGTNESGFSAIGGGCCMFNGIWGNPGTFSTGFWWTSSKYNNKPLYRYLDYNKPNIFRYYGPNTYGFSIRCVKD